jgi:hypothetical protein
MLHWRPIQVSILEIVIGLESGYSQNDPSSDDKLSAGLNQGSGILSNGKETIARRI